MMPGRSQSERTAYNFGQLSGNDDVRKLFPIAQWLCGQVAPLQYIDKNFDEFANLKSRAGMWDPNKSHFGLRTS